jgi:hypothetical protein
MFAVPTRHFSHSKTYGDIDWGDRNLVLDAIRTRFNEWYVLPMNALDSVAGGGFSEVALGCILIDMISQYVYNLKESKGERFRELLDDFIPEIKIVSKVSIDTGKIRNKKKIILKSGADVVWQGFRCGILHEANAYMCCKVSGGPPVFRIETDQTFGEGGATFDTFVINPGLFRDKVTEIFDGYFEALIQRKNFGIHTAATIENNFKEKFSRAFGFKLTY